jgi:hypothetical protein
MNALAPRPLYRRDPDRQSRPICRRAPPTRCAGSTDRAEDKRVTAKLLAHIGAKRPMTAYHDHSDDGLRPHLPKRMGSKAIALVSDAGDAAHLRPGLQAGPRARAAGIAVHTLPGAVRRDRRADAGRAADRPLPVPRLPSGQGQGARRGDRRGRGGPRQPRPLRKRPAARRQPGRARARGLATARRR